MGELLWLVLTILSSYLDTSNCNCFYFILFLLAIADLVEICRRTDCKSSGHVARQTNCMNSGFYHIIPVYWFIIYLPTGKNARYPVRSSHIAIPWNQSCKISYARLDYTHTPRYNRWMLKSYRTLSSVCGKRHDDRSEVSIEKQHSAILGCSGTFFFS